MTVAPVLPLAAIIVLGAGTYAFRLAGPMLHERLRLPPQVHRLLSVAAAVLLVALIATAALTEGHGFAGWSRPAGVLVGGVLAVRRLPFPVVVLAAMGTTAVLRLLGLP
ncbi:MAG TPA: AzlD domain-containing protein [Pseudonocardiaceae bacterium]|jgi:branched-subunit amino acid transport protein|nr:AzlD domain-containing protein [Pseudonocardiaceae bacterium]